MNELWNTHLFTLGTQNIMVGTLVSIVLYLVVLAGFTQFIKRKLVFRLFRRSHVDPGVQYATARISSYVLWIVGLLSMLPWLGLEFKSIMVALGAIGVGLGLGLQNLADNFVSGLVLLFERPVKVGDRVQLNDGVQGQIVGIHARATVIRTNESIDILVPNSEFVSQRVTNLSLSNRLVRFRFPIGVSYSSDVEQVREALLTVGNASPSLAAGQKPDVLFLGCGDSSLNFVLRVPSDTMLHTPDVFATQIYFAIWAEFARRKIEIPFPQRDLHLRSTTPLSVQLLEPGNLSWLQNQVAKPPADR
ncbi:Potassium efflux system KefA protein / Small-conductance mechanosensitive channel [Enhygromyxa salina]|uniref:Potassium efflux system KefA protein / Small-conductance mechanosensitive channel n=1 Tax=Enhygromyxa salina TaxID=215803 RepID=A0A0C1ZW28_9BACT|nr:mechanosensitive ion channel domain-containing protein [Enhygromyxa salina]KIG15228.1 Potassium efflux system KefA protein / Small-conductance mechanosensitive channel [Enhygromyxa salina]